METPENIIGFLGRGWAYPPAFDKVAKGTNMVTDAEDVRQSLEILLATQVGERVMNRKYGSGLELMLHEPLSNTNIHAIAATLTDAIGRYEPRIKVDNVSLHQEDPADGRIDILLEYTISATNSRQNLVFPYYQERGGAQQ